MDLVGRIKDAAPVLPSANFYPALQPVGQAGPVFGTGKPLSLETLEHRDLFFSSTSARSHIERFLTKPQAYQLSFGFRREPPISLRQRLLDAPHALMLVEKSTSLEPVEAPSLKAADSVTAEAPKAAHAGEASRQSMRTQPLTSVRMRLIEYADVSSTPVVLQASLGLSAKPAYQVQRFAYVPKTGQLYSEAAFAAQGIQAIQHPTRAKIMNWLRERLPAQPPKWLPVQIEPDGTVHLGSGLKFNPTVSWKDASGNRARIYDLMRLENPQLAQVVEVKNQRSLKDLLRLPLNRMTTRRDVKAEVLAQVEAVEAQGYFLEPGRVRYAEHKAPLPKPMERAVRKPRLDKESVLVGNSKASNPFVTVDFGATPTQVDEKPVTAASSKATRPVGRPRKPPVEVPAVEALAVEDDGLALVGFPVSNTEKSKTIKSKVASVPPAEASTDDPFHVKNSKAARNQSPSD